MYYLNDKHPIYQYSLYCKMGSGCPYLINTYDSMQEIFVAIEMLENKHNHYHQQFYIDNDFYINTYPLFEDSFYYKFLRRKVNDWEEFKIN